LVDCMPALVDAYQQRRRGAFTDLLLLNL
jgi:hypothetical protein